MLTVIIFPIMQDLFYSQYLFQSLCNRTCLLVANPSPLNKYDFSLVRVSEAFHSLSCKSLSTQLCPSSCSHRQHIQIAKFCDLPLPYLLPLLLISFTAYLLDLVSLTSLHSQSISSILVSALQVMSIWCPYIAL